MNRQSRIAYYAKIAKMVATRGTCSRRKVGAVVTNKAGFILATGYNGRPPGVVECLDDPCKGLGKASGEGLCHCHAQHAEMSIINQIPDTSKMFDLYVTTSPCVECTKVLLHTGVQNIYYWEGYSDRQMASYYWKRYRPKGRWQALTNGNATCQLDIQTRFDLQWVEDPLSGCWEWQSSKNRTGYGYFDGSGKRYHREAAHRASYMLYHKKDPEDLFVCHKCDNPGCVNPDHLFLGTNSENIIDSIKKGRLGKFSEKDICEIRLLSESITITELAKKYNHSNGGMSRIVYGESYSCYNESAPPKRKNK